MNKKIIITSTMCILLHSLCLFSYRLSREERASLKYKDGDTFMEFLANNPEYEKKRILAANGIQVTEENREKVSEIVSSILKKNSTSPPDTPKVTHGFTEFIYEAKYPVLVGSLALATYSYIITKLYKAKKYINKTISWSWFKKSVPLNVLYEIPEDKLVQELTEAIYRTYSGDDNNFNNASEPLSLFLKVTNKEIKQLENFTNLYWYVKLPIVSLFFPNLDDEFILAQENIERLSYMQDLISNQIAAMNS